MEVLVAHSDNPVMEEAECRDVQVLAAGPHQDVQLQYLAGHTLDRLVADYQTLDRPGALARLAAKSQAVKRLEALQSLEVLANRGQDVHRKEESVNLDRAARELTPAQPGERCNTIFRCAEVPLYFFFLLFWF